MSDLSQPVYLLGDLNIDVLQYNACELATTYIDTLFSHGLLQIISRPTRCTSNSATIIDHIITNMIHKDLSSTIIISYMSDHFPIVHHLKNQFIVPSPKIIENRDFSVNNINLFTAELNAANWSEVYKSQDAQLSYNKFSDTFLGLYNDYFPVKTCKFNIYIHTKNSWMTKGLLVSRKEKIRLSKCYFKKPTPYNHQLLKNYQKLYNSVIRAAKKLYFDQLFTKYQSNLKLTWQLINEIIQRKKTDKENISSILIENKE